MDAVLAYPDETASDAGARVPPRRHDRPVVLMICGLFGLPYRALRCAVAAGATVHVLGNARATGFRFSRYCASFSRTDRPLDGSFDDALAAEINALIARLDIAIVMAGDQPSSRTLVGLRPKLDAPCFPMPDLATFDLLNNKWEFYKLCTGLGVPCPPTTLLPDRDAVAREIAEDALALPLITKPLALDGSRGVVPVLKPRDVAAELATIRYQPVLVQKFIPGVNISASAFADNGTIRAFILYQRTQGAYVSFSNDLVLDSIRRIARATSYSGVFNFDMRMAPDGQIYFLECNARFFYTMDLSMLVGVNFAAHGLDPTLPATFVSGPRVRLFKAFLLALATPWRLTRRDFALLAHRYSDPLTHARELLRIDWEDQSY